MSGRRVSMVMSALVWLAGCRSDTPRVESSAKVEPESEPEPEPEPEPKLKTAMPVAIAGCHGLSAEPRCLRRSEEGALHLWLEVDWAPEELALSLDGRVLGPESVSRSSDIDGVWIKLADPQPGLLRLEHPEHQAFELRVEAHSDAYQRAYARLRNSEPVEAEGLEPREAFMLECWKGIRSPVTEQLHADARRVDELRCLGQRSAAAAHEALEREDDEAFAAALEPVRAHPRLDLYGRVKAAYYGAIADSRLGLLADAVEGHARSARLAEHIDRIPDLASARVEEAVVLTTLGRFEQAERLASEAVALAREPTVKPALRVEIRHDAAWTTVLSPTGDLDAASVELSEVAREFEANTDPRRAAIARLNLAVAQVRLGAYEAAEASLERVDRSQLEGRQQLYYELTAARVDLESGRSAQARTRLDRAETIAKLGDDREFVLDLLDLRAELEQRDGQTDAALAVYARAEQLADERARSIPAHAGRSNYWTTLTRARARHVELALSAGLVERALCTSLGARARHLRALAVGLQNPSERQRVEYTAALARYLSTRGELERRLASAWELSEHELEQLGLEESRTLVDLDAQLDSAMKILEREVPDWRCVDARPHAADAALLTAYPIADEQGWNFMLDRAGRIDRVRAEGTPEEAVTIALAGLAPRLEGVEELTVVALGGLLGVDFEARAREYGGPRVRYSLGLGNVPDGESDPVAVVLAGRSNLELVAIEVEAVREQLAAHAWPLAPSWDASARPPRLLHYAGHASHDGWDSDLVLETGRLTSAQILLEQRAPQIVILSACEAGAADVQMLDGGMNVAVAFLLAGARVVIAADRQVDDSAALAFSAALHAALPRREALDADAVVAALAQLHRDDPRFAAWRVWVP